MRLNWLKFALITGLTLVVVLALSIVLQLNFPAPSGYYPVGETVFRWTDSSRPETMTDDSADSREVVALVWYPAEQGNETGSPYFPGLSTVFGSLIESGEVAWWEARGLQFIRTSNMWNGMPAKGDAPYPVVIFSPGNGTNAEFYTAFASELASHGYIVVGVNHPYDVAAVELSDRKVAQFDQEQWPVEMRANENFVTGRIQVRMEDVLFTLNRLEDLNENPDNPFAGMLNLKSVAVAGHSLGGITASEACKEDVRFRACINLDGIQRGGPFSTEETAAVPGQPFLFLTKESKLPPKLIAKFESMTESYWVVVKGASHESFTDGPILQPGLLPIPNRADHIASLIQKYTLAFLDQTLKEQGSELLSKSSESQESTVHVFPSN